MMQNTSRPSIRSSAGRNRQTQLPKALAEDAPVAGRDSLEDLKRENAALRAALAEAQDQVQFGGDPLGYLISSHYSPGPRVALARDGKFASAFDFNAPEDTKYAHKADGFDGVLHVFHREWLGIRAAAGSLPGQKLAISASGPLIRADIRNFFGCAEAMKASRFVFHGMSDNAAHLIRHLAKAGLSHLVYLVYHGNVSQWCYEPERRIAFKALEIIRRGHARRIHFLKKDHCMVEGRTFMPMLLNMSPVVPVKSSNSAGSVLIPGTDDWRKNVFCNALGAAMSGNVNSIIHYAKSIELPPPHSGKLRHVNFADRSSTFQLMALCMCTLYVSIVECHPMVNLESEAVGTPCLRGPLNLDVLEDHPYVRLVNVADPTNPFEIRDGIDRVAAVPRAEIREMMSDYLCSVNRTSLLRYRDFLEI